jgi:hypothetical protein
MGGGFGAGVVAPSGISGKIQAGLSKMGDNAMANAPSALLNAGIAALQPKNSVPGAASQRAGLDMQTFGKQQGLADTASANVADPRTYMAQSQNASAKAMQDQLESNPNMAPDARRALQAKMSSQGNLDAQTAYATGQGQKMAGLSTASGMYKAAPSTGVSAAEAEQTANSADTRGLSNLATALFDDPNKTKAT